MKKTVLLAIVLFLYIQSAFSQELPTIIPPGPNASSLAQYVDVPVSKYTGIPNINIPLYDVYVDGKINIPLSFSYHARGVKLAELSSSFGLGWSLNAGGTISRQIRGNADDSPKGYLKQNYYETFFALETTRRNAHTEDVNGNFDRMPDQFIFNFSGHSGKFIFDRDNTNLPILETFDDLKIEPIGDVSLNIEGFVITDANGVKYYFGKSSNGSITAIEENYPLENFSFSYDMGITQNFSNSRTDITSWHLLEIIEPFGEKVSFTYELEEAETYRKSEEVFIGSEGPLRKVVYFSKEKLNQLKIKKITFQNGEVNFNYNFIREDLKGYNGSIPKALSSIEVLNSYQRIKKYNFDYVYTSSTVSNNIINHLNQNAPEAKKRLFLDKITQEGDDNEFLPPHKFTYNPTVLPSRFSTSHDKWGYYNGKNNGDFAVFGNVSEIGGTAIDTVKVQASLLTKIEYPTGGSAEYTYQSNRAEFPDHLRDHIAFIQNNPVIERQVSMEKDSMYYDSQTATYSIPFTIENIVESSVIPGSGTVIASVFLPYSECTIYESYDCPYLVRIYNEDNTLHAILHKTFNTFSTNNTPQAVTIVPGNYILKVISNNPNTEDPNDWENDFGVSLEWSEVEENEDELLYTGGNRIKKTILKDEQGNTIEREYEYLYSNGETSGKVFGLPPYFGYQTITTTNGQVFRELLHVNFRPVTTLTLEQGNHGGYSYVTEYLGSKEHNIGKREFSYTTPYDEGEYYRPAYHLPNSRERFRGKPRQILDYKKNNESSSYELVKKTNNFYSFNEYDDGTNDRNFKSVKLAVFNYLDKILSGTFVAGSLHNYYKTFFLDYGVVKLTSTQVTEYFEDGNVYNDTNYFYDFDKHYQTKSVEIHNPGSSSNIFKSLYDYPQDLQNPSLAEQTLIAQHRIATPIQTETTLSDLDGTVLSKNTLRTNYKDFGNNLILPENIQTSKGLNSLEPRIRIIYYDYDDFGNPLEVSKADGTHIVYIWGYNHSQPIAKIENATYAQVLSHVPNLQTKSNNDTHRSVDTIAENGVKIYANDSEGNLREALDGLRDTLPNALVTTYTYDPLIGVTSMTDPRGSTIYYNYDAFNRLKHVKDQDGNILSKNDYNYKN